MNEQLKEHREKIQGKIRESLERHNKVFVRGSSHQSATFFIARCGVKVSPRQLYYIGNEEKACGLPNKAIIIDLELWGKFNEQKFRISERLEHIPDVEFVFTSTDYWVQSDEIASQVFNGTYKWKDQTIDDE